MIMLISAILSLTITVAGVAVNVAKGATAVEAVVAINNALDINNMSGLKVFDSPYMNITGNALSMLGNFMYYAQLLVAFCAFLCLIFNAIKLWCAAEEIKKFYADTIYKCLIVMVLMNVYPTVINRTYNFATELGVEASGGSDIVVTSFANLAKNMKAIWESGTQAMVAELQQGAEKDGTIVVNQKLLDTFTSYGMTDEEARAWAQQHGWEISDKTNKKKVNSRQKSAIKRFKNETEKKKYMKQSMAVVHAMSQILTGTSESAMADGAISAADVLSMGDKALDNVFYNPYIKGTKRLSFSAMMKTAVVIAECASAGGLASSTPDDKSKQASWEDLTKSKNPQLMFSFISTLLMNKLVYKVLMIVAIGYCMIEYIVTLVEYLVVSAVSALLIPFFFIDSLKQFTANILKTVLSYFVKILVTTMMIFFVVSMYIDLGSLIIARKDLDSVMSLLVYACITILGMVLVKNTGKIAGAVVSGNPTLGLGDVVNQTRGMTHVVHHVEQSVQRDAQKVQKAAQATASAAAGGFQTLDSMHVAAFQAGKKVDAARDSGEWGGTGFDRFKVQAGAAASTFGQAAKQKIGDSLHKAAFGTERHHLDNGEDTEGYWHIGQQVMFKNKQIIATAEDVKKHNEEIAARNAENSFNSSLSSNRVQKDKERPYPWPEEGH